MISLLRFKAEEKGIQLHSDWKSAMPKSIITDPARLRQVLLNVIGNAVKFTERGGVNCEINLISEEAAGRAKLEFVVRDTESASVFDQQKRLFQPFVQADSSMARKFGGTGLGLSLSRRIAMALGGELVLAESQIGRGSTFKLVISVGVPELAQNTVVKKEDESQKSSPLKKRLEGLKILLAEDAPDNRLLLSKVLKHLGAQVEVACDGQEAVTKAMAQEFDVILMDIQMPGLYGYEATDHLRARGYEKPIIALTAHAMKEERQRSLRSGFNDYVTKPIDREELISSLIRVSGKEKLL